MSLLNGLPCIDSDEMAASRRRELDIDRGKARKLGMSALAAIQSGHYTTRFGQNVVWRDTIETARARKKSIPPDAELPPTARAPHNETRVQVTNETTLAAAHRLTDAGLVPLARNFAHGIHPGGGFMNGARAQEEDLCRSSALYQTLVGDLMYETHEQRPEPDSTDWAILSPDVPVFRIDDGIERSASNRYRLSPGIGGRFRRRVLRYCLRDR